MTALRQTLPIPVPVALGGTGATGLTGLALGSSTATTQSVGDNTTKLATTAFVTAAVPAGVTAPTFSAYAATPQSPTSNVYTKVTLGTELFDTNNNFATSRFTPTVSGYYQINATLYATDSVAITTAEVSIYKNGSEYIRGGGVFASAGTNNVQSMSAVINFNGTTDYVELFGLVAGTAPTFGAASAAVASSLSGSFLHA